MGEITQVRPRAQDILEHMSPEIYREAYGRGMSLSAFLEQQDPSEGYNDGMDAFSRIMRCAGIQTRSIPELGAYADKWEKFYANERSRALLPEWIARTWRRAASGRDPSTRSLYLSSDATPGSLMRPYVDAAQARMKQIAPAIPLAELVAITTPIDSDAYRAFYLTDVTAEERMLRVPEGTDVPTAKLTGGDNTIILKKFGRGLEASYEQLRRQRIDKVALHIARLAVQSESDKVAAAIDVLVSGDGNASTAATSYNLTTLDTTAVAGTLTLKGWLALKMKFSNPYACIAAIAQEAIALQMVLLTTGTANTPLVSISGASGLGSFRAINPGLSDATGLGWTADAPANKIVAVDTRFALEHVTEIGANITEIEKFVQKQTQLLVMTETEGFCIFDQNATKVMAVNA